VLREYIDQAGTGERDALFCAPIRNRPPGSSTQRCGCVQPSRGSPACARASAAARACAAGRRGTEPLQDGGDQAVDLVDALLMEHPVQQQDGLAPLGAAECGVTRCAVQQAGGALGVRQAAQGLGGQIFLEGQVGDGERGEQQQVATQVDLVFALAGVELGQVVPGMVQQREAPIGLLGLIGLDSGPWPAHHRPPGVRQSPVGRRT
jgi:hypothetical protein